MDIQFLVIGLGRFGSTLARTLIANGHEVLAVDKDEALVEDISSVATHALQADCTDEAVLRNIGARNFSHAIVCIGEDQRASVLITLLLKELNISQVIAKATDEIHGRLLSKVGADHIVYPEMDMAAKLGHQLSSKNIIDFIELSPEYSLIEFNAPSSIKGMSLEQLKIREKFDCTVIAIKSPAGQINVAPIAEDRITTDDILIIIGSNINIEKLERYFAQKMKWRM